MDAGVQHDKAGVWFDLKKHAANVGEQIDLTAGWEVHPFDASGQSVAEQAAAMSAELIRLLPELAAFRSQTEAAATKLMDAVRTAAAGPDAPAAP